MKNSDHPLMQALKSKNSSGKPPEHPFAQFEAPRSFEINHEEIPGLPGKKVGEAISVRLEGHVHSQNNDGHAVMHVASVKPDSTEMTDKENEGRKTPSESGAVSVKTQESHAP